MFLDYFSGSTASSTEKTAALQRLRREPHDGIQLAGQHPGDGESSETLRNRGNEPQIIRELSTPKPIISSVSGLSPLWGIRETPRRQSVFANRNRSVSPAPPAGDNGATHSASQIEMPSLLEIGQRAAMQAEREAIERVLAQTRWNRRQAAKIFRISYKALLNKLKAMEEQNQIQTKQRSA